MTIKKLDKDELMDKIKSLIRKRDQIIIDISKIEKELINLQDDYKEISGEYNRTECLTCGGTGYIESPEDSNKKVICKNPTIPFLSCNGKGYIWLKKYVEK